MSCHVTSRPLQTKLLKNHILEPNPKLDLSLSRARAWLCLAQCCSNY